MVDFTTVVGVDAEHLEEWRTTWPAWKANRSRLHTRPLLAYTKRPSIMSTGPTALARPASAAKSLSFF